MGFDRFSAKIKARGSMRQNRPSPVMVSLGFLILTILLYCVISWLLFVPVRAFFEYYLYWGYDVEDILLYLAAEYPAEIQTFEVFSFLFGIYQTIMKFGYTSYIVRMARNEQPGFTHIFDGFLRPVHALGSALLQGLFILLWTLPFQAGAAAFLYWSIQQNSLLFLALFWACMIGTMIIGLIKEYSYRLTWYFMLDDPACSSWKAISRSKQYMRGWKLDLLFLDLSFLGWKILSWMTLGILDVWVKPYQSAAEVNFYDFLISGADRQEGGGEEAPAIL